MNIKIKGLNEAIARMSTMPDRLNAELKNELQATADKIRKNAASDAPADQGKLRNSIVVTKTNDLNYKVIVQNSYAAFMEWGTKGKTSVPGELSAYASQFKGIKGTGTVSPVDALQAWVKRKGLAGTYSVKSRRRQGSTQTKDKQDRAIAFAIWNKIRKTGVTPHPFFFKNVFAEQARFEGVIKNIFKNL